MDSFCEVTLVTSLPNLADPDPQNTSQTVNTCNTQKTGNTPNTWEAVNTCERQNVYPRKRRKTNLEASDVKYKAPIRELVTNSDLLKVGTCKRFGRDILSLSCSSNYSWLAPGYRGYMIWWQRIWSISASIRCGL